MDTSSMVTVRGDRIAVRFERFDLDAYRLFLRAKTVPEQTVRLVDEERLHYEIDMPARFAGMLGVEVPAAPGSDLPFASHLFDDQREVLAQALDAKRFALWAACGWGKSAFSLEYARQVIHRTGGRVLITTVNEVVPQWVEECHKFYGDALPILRLRSRAEMIQWMGAGDGVHSLAVTNYEKWNPEDIDHQVVNEARHLAGVILDENRLKTGGGKQKWAIIKSCKGVEYKLSCTATPAPNDLMEFASQASFLEKMRTEQDIIWTYFRRDEKTHRWTVKPHARQAFFDFMSTWSIYIDDPRRFGWRKEIPVPPAPVEFVHELEPTEEQRAASMLGTSDGTGQLCLIPEPGHRNFVQANQLSQVAKGFRYVLGSRGVADRYPEQPAVAREPSGLYERIPSLKPGFVARLTRDELAAGHTVLVWTVFDAESDLIAEELQRLGMAFGLLTGKVKPAQRSKVLEAFRSGASKVLVTRASMLGWGVNLQVCNSMIFSGWSFSFEQHYQAVRRAYRHGQTRQVRIHIPVVRGLEDDILDAIRRKEGEYATGIREMERCYLDSRLRQRGGAA